MADKSYQRLPKPVASKCKHFTPAWDGHALCYKCRTERGHVCGRSSTCDVCVLWSEETWRLHERRVAARPDITPDVRPARAKSAGGTPSVWPPQYPFGIPPCPPPPHPPGFPQPSFSQPMPGYSWFPGWPWQPPMPTPSPPELSPAVSNVDTRTPRRQPRSKKAKLSTPVLSLQNLGQKAAKSRVSLGGSSPDDSPPARIQVTAEIHRQEDVQSGSRVVSRGKTIGQARPRVEPDIVSDTDDARPGQSGLSISSSQGPGIGQLRPRPNLELEPASVEETGHGRHRPLTRSASKTMGKSIGQPRPMDIPIASHVESVGERPGAAADASDDASGQRQLRDADLEHASLRQLEEHLLQRVDERMARVLHDFFKSPVKPQVTQQPQQPQPLPTASGVRISDDLESLPAGTEASTPQVDLELAKVLKWNDACASIRLLLGEAIPLVEASPKRKLRTQTAGDLEGQQQLPERLPLHPAVKEGLDLCMVEVQKPSTKSKKDLGPLQPGVFLKHEREAAAKFFKPEGLSSFFYPQKVNADLSSLSSATLGQVGTVNLSERDLQDKEAALRTQMAVISTSKWNRQAIHTALQKFHETSDVSFLTAVEKLLQHEDSLQSILEDRTMTALANTVLSRRDLQLGMLKSSLDASSVTALRSASLTDQKLFGDIPEELIVKEKKRRESQSLLQALQAKAKVQVVTVQQQPKTTQHFKTPRKQSAPQKASTKPQPRSSSESSAERQGQFQGFQQPSQPSQPKPFRGKGKGRGKGRF